MSREDREALAELLAEWRKTCKIMGIRWTDSDAAAFAIAAGWVSPEQHQQAVRDAEEKGAGDTERIVRLAWEEERAKARGRCREHSLTFCEQCGWVNATAARMQGERLAEVEAERDDWKRRHARVQEMYRERFNAGLSDADWYRHCAAMATVERVRALPDRWREDRAGYPLDDVRAAIAFFAVKQCGEELQAALNGASELDAEQTEWVDIHRDCAGNWHVDDGIRYCDDCGYAEHVLVDATRLPVRKRDGGES